jgi:hypothetical protein
VELINLKATGVERYLNEEEQRINEEAKQRIKADKAVALERTRAAEAAINEQVSQRVGMLRLAATDKVHQLTMYDSNEVRKIAETSALAIRKSAADEDKAKRQTEDAKLKAREIMDADTAKIGSATEACAEKTRKLKADSEEKLHTIQASIAAATMGADKTKDEAQREQSTAVRKIEQLKSDDDAAIKRKQAAQQQLRSEQALAGTRVHEARVQAADDAAKVEADATSKLTAQRALIEQEKTRAKTARTLQREAEGSLALQLRSVTTALERRQGAATAAAAAQIQDCESQAIAHAAAEEASKIRAAKANEVATSKIQVVDRKAAVALQAIDAKAAVDVREAKEEASSRSASAIDKVAVSAENAKNAAQHDMEKSRQGQMDALEIDKHSSSNAASAISKAREEADRAVNDQVMAAEALPHASLLQESTSPEAPGSSPEAAGLDDFD